MNNENSAFAPLDLDRAKALRDLINQAVRDDHAVLISERGVKGSGRSDLISPNEDVNGLVRYQRHY